ncbi:hypothetical protein [Salinibacter ruber]|uniref:hypothetical protein n=1 Tax=Salinibacter ruber TaxID=146919 RepID=UPI0021681F64|nr:hypothetical protein [Salinibacter ruber]MCS4198367.1 hypothetical protein [Salinibacter ruber]
MRSRAEEVAGTGELYRPVRSEMLGAESRAARIGLLRAAEDYASGEVSGAHAHRARVVKRAEEVVEDALGRRPVGEQETEVILDAARALRGADKTGRWALAQWATGVRLNQHQREVLNSWRRTVAPSVGAEIEPPEIKLAPESAAQIRSRGRLRARMARLNEEEADEVEAAIEARAAVVPTEQARRKAEAKLDALRRERQRVPEGRQALTPDQEKVVVGVIWLDSARRQGGREVGKQDDGTYGGTYKDYMSDVRGQLRDMEVGGTDDLRGLLRESERRVLEDQIYLAGADPEVRRAFGPGAPSEQQREIYRQARDVAMCSHYKSEPTGMGDRPREEWPGRWERKTRAELVRTMRDGSVREEVRELSQMDGPVADAIEQAWEASQSSVDGAEWVAGTSLNDRQERALRAADPGRDLDWGADRAFPQVRPQRIRRPELRATLAGLSGPEFQALRRVVKAWPKVHVSSGREEEVRQAKEAVQEECSRVDERPEVSGKAPGELEETQEMALAEVYRLEELVEKKLVEEGASEDEIRDGIRGLGDPEKPSHGSAPVQAGRSMNGFREQLRDLSSEEIQELESHLEDEEIAKQLLTRGVDLAREAKRREELRAKARETAETALKRTRQRLQGGERVKAARVLREAQATLNGSRSEAPESFGPEVEKRLERRLKESLREPEFRELRRGLAEADVEDGRAEGGDPEAARALSGPQREAANSLEKAARFATIPGSDVERKSNLREAARAMAGMSEEERFQIRRAASPEAQEAFKAAEHRLEETRSEKTEQKSRKTQSQKSQSRSRGRGR